jgi:hypothetical protein
MMFWRVRAPFPAKMFALYASSLLIFHTQDLTRTTLHDDHSDQTWAGKDAGPARGGTRFGAGVSRWYSMDQRGKF